MISENEETLGASAPGATYGCADRRVGFILVDRRYGIPIRSHQGKQTTIYQSAGSATGAQKRLTKWPKGQVGRTLRGTIKSVYINPSQPELARQMGFMLIGPDGEPCRTRRRRGGVVKLLSTAGIAGRTQGFHPGSSVHRVYLRVGVNCATAAKSRT